MKEASEMKYGDQVEGLYVSEKNDLNYVDSRQRMSCSEVAPARLLIGQTWEDIIRVMTSATVRFELLSTVHTSPVS